MRGRRERGRGGGGGAGVGGGRRRGGRGGRECSNFILPIFGGGSGGKPKF